MEQLRQLALPPLLLAQHPPYQQERLGGMLGTVLACSLRFQTRNVSQADAGDVPP